MNHFTKFACFICFLPSIGLAGGDIVDASSTSPGIGFSLAYSDPAGGYMVAGLDYYTSNMEAGVNFSAEINESVKSGKADWNQLSAGLYLGRTMPFKGDVVFSYGLEGNYTFVSSKEDYNQGKEIDHNPYVAGPYVGLAYHPNAHVKVFARVMPVSYETFGYDAGSENADNSGKQNEWEIFNEGTMGIAYYFG